MALYTSSRWTLSDRTLETVECEVRCDECGCGHVVKMPAYILAGHYADNDKAYYLDKSMEDRGEKCPHYRAYVNTYLR